MNSESLRKNSNSASISLNKTINHLNHVVPVQVVFVSKQPLTLQCRLDTLQAESYFLTSLIKPKAFHVTYTFSVSFERKLYFLFKKMRGQAKEQPNHRESYN